MSDSGTDIETRVRRRAYELWEEAGRPEGRGDEFWHQAQADIMPAMPVGVENTDPVIDGPPTREGEAKRADRATFPK